MSRTQRFALLGGAVVVLLAVILLTRGGDAETPTPQAAASTQSSTPTPAPATTPAVVGTTPTTPARKPKPKPDPGPILTADELTTITSRVGRTIRFRARSAEGDEVHVHGYDKSVDAPAGEVVSVQFTATMPGIFEVEFENSAVAIGKLEVGE
jgi:hypothetical protein